MTQGDSSDIKLAIGRLQGEVAALIRQWGEQDRAATEGRRALRQEVGQLRTDVTLLAGQVGEMKEDMADTKRVEQQANNRRQQSIGSRRVIALIWSVIVTVIGGSTVVLVEVLRHFWQGKP